MERVLLKPAQAAEALQLSRAKLYSLIAGGELKSIKIGGARRIPIEALREFVARQLAEQAEAAR